MKKTYGSTTTPHYFRADGRWWMLTIDRGYTMVYGTRYQGPIVPGIAWGSGTKCWYVEDRIRTGELRLPSKLRAMIDPRSLIRRKGPEVTKFTHELELASQRLQSA